MCYLLQDPTTGQSSSEVRFDLSTPVYARLVRVASTLHKNVGPILLAAQVSRQKHHLVMTRQGLAQQRYRHLLFVQATSPPTLPRGGLGQVG